MDNSIKTMKKKVTFIELLPDEGNWLTQVELAEGEERIFSECVYCPSNQEDCWEEWSTERKEAFEAELEQEMAAQVDGTWGG